MSETKTVTSGVNTATPPKARPTWKPAGKVAAGEQPFTYPLKREFVEPEPRFGSAATPLKTLKN
jgi:hypothetical protein